MNKLLHSEDWPVLDLPDPRPTLDDSGLDLEEPPSLNLDPVDPATCAETKLGTDLSVFQSALKDRVKEEQARFTQATDSEYWIAVCFQSRAQKEEFLEKTGLIHFGDKYLDGIHVAVSLGIELETADPNWKDSKPSERLKKLAT